jgi:hypothetical protein
MRAVFAPDRSVVRRFRRRIARQGSCVGPERKSQYAVVCLSSLIRVFTKFRRRFVVIVVVVVIIIYYVHSSSAAGPSGNVWLLLLLSGRSHWSAVSAEPISKARRRDAALEGDQGTRRRSRQCIMPSLRFMFFMFFLPSIIDKTHSLTRCVVSALSRFLLGLFYLALSNVLQGMYPSSSLKSAEFFNMGVSVSRSEQGKFINCKIKSIGD